MPSLRQIRYFLGAADTGKVSAAAALLNISQSSVTVAIQELEAELGVTLFERHAGGLRLTHEGQKFLPYALNIEASVADAVKSMRQSASGIAGEVRLGTTAGPSGYLLFPILERFRRSQPDIAIRVVECRRPDLQRMLLSGELDLGLMLISNLTDRSRYRTRCLLRSQRGLWLSSAHPLARQKSISFADLRDEPYVMFELDEADQTLPMVWKKYGFSPNIVFTTGVPAAVRTFVATGGAVTILSELLYRPWSLDGGRVEMRVLQEPIPTMDVGFVWKRRRELSGAEVALCDYFAAACNS
ncbi:MAG: LysR family transcriptional regulator [Alphaproteobacteria bacterium]